MRKYYLLTLLLLSFAAQAQDTLRMVNFNMLNVNVASMLGTGTTTNRAPHYRAIFQHLQPDVLALEEITDAATVGHILNLTLNVNGKTFYQAAQFIDGPDSDNMLIYNSNKVGLLRQGVVKTALRDINYYDIYYKHANLAQGADTVKARIFLVHLKASQGTAEEAQRAAEVQNLITFMNANPFRNQMVSGDFNLYTASEAAYQALVTNATAPFRDPINRPGAWNNNAAFADIHTQSPRVAQFGGGSNGGIDDRFDFILPTPNMVGANPQTLGNDSLVYIPGSYRAVGNDGRHFNLAIIDPPVNTSAPDSVIQGIYNGSDHLPVAMNLLVRPYTVNSSRGLLARQPVNGFYRNGSISLSGLPANATLRIADATGRLLFAGSVNAELNVQTGPLPAGIYMLQATAGQTVYGGKLLVVE